MSRAETFAVHVGFDEETHLYHVLSSDIPGLNVEASTFEDFVDIVRDVAPDLLDRPSAGTRIVFEREVALA